ncbi:MAG: hypothetical protein P9M14_12870 [Candidatus Alcyoniella australis]|nr:hypothetical protein [Candidatus Alcyoniella australis]
MRSAWLITMVLAALLLCGWIVVGCGSDDDDDDVAGDDDSADDDDDDQDDDSLWDDDDQQDDCYVASWPQQAVMPREYNETGVAGPIRLKAEAFDLWHLTWHQPDYGGSVHAYFTDDSYTEIENYHGLGDSCSWTGVYLGTQSMRWWVTGEQQARDNVIAKVATLDGFLHVNGKPGFISRYRGSQDGNPWYVSDAWCDAGKTCFRVESGEFAGDFWIGNTSRDMYIGWFYGMAMAYDHIDDQATLQIIRDDVTEVIDELIDTDWLIINTQGEQITAGPKILPPMQLCFLTIGYHVTGELRFKHELQKRLADSNRRALEINSFNFFNRYQAYFGNDLAHVCWYNILRLGRVYYSADDYYYLLGLFENQVHNYTRLSHNPWFNAIYMAQGAYQPTDDDPYLEQLHQDLSEFRDPPLWEYHLEARDPASYTLDPISVLLHDIVVLFPLLEDLVGNVDYQSNEPFGVRDQCPAGFMFQWCPYEIKACGTSDRTKVHSGHDFLAAYWMAGYNKFITRGQ